MAFSFWRNATLQTGRSVLEPQHCWNWFLECSVTSNSNKNLWHDILFWLFIIFCLYRFILFYLAFDIVWFSLLLVFFFCLLSFINVCKVCVDYISFHSLINKCRCLVNSLLSGLTCPFVEHGSCCQVLLGCKCIEQEHGSILQSFILRTSHLQPL